MPDPIVAITYFSLTLRLPTVYNSVNIGLLEVTDLLNLLSSLCVKSLEVKPGANLEGCGRGNC